MSQVKDPNQGEGDRASARRYDNRAREFVAEGKVDPAAREAEAYVERDPEGAAKAEADAKRGPSSAGSHGASVDQIVQKGKSLLERARPMVERAVGSLRARLHRK